MEYKFLDHTQKIQVLSDRCKESLQKRKDASLKEIQQRIFLRADERSKIRIAFESTLPH